MKTTVRNLDTGHKTTYVDFSITSERNASSIKWIVTGAEAGLLPPKQEITCHSDIREACAALIMLVECSRLKQTGQDLTEDS